MKPIYYITDIEDFVNGARAIVYNNFGTKSNDDDEEVLDILLSSIKPEEQEEFDKVLSYNESLMIVKQHVKKQKHKQTSAVRYILDEDIFMSIVESLNSRMVSNLLMKMSKDGLIESAFDENLNDFVFWVKNEN